MPHTHHARAVRRPPEPLYWFITGGAGTGKSYTIHLAYELLRRAHRGVSSNPVVLMAPTGVAAANIAATTMHSALALPVENVRKRGRTRVTYKALPAAKLAEQRAMWSGVRYINLEKVSMVSYPSLTFIHRRLVEITGVQAAYGGVSVLFFGDYFQLPPVNPRNVFPPHEPAFKRSAHTASIPGLRDHLWRDYVVHVTSNNQRSLDPAWTRIQNALRDCCDPEEVEEALDALQGRLTVEVGGPVRTGPTTRFHSASRLFVLNKRVKEYNTAKLEALQVGTTHPVRSHLVLACLDSQPAQHAVCATRPHAHSLTHAPCGSDTLPRHAP